LKNIIINTSNLQKGGALQVALSFINESANYPHIFFHIILGRESNKVISEIDYEGKLNLRFYLVDFHPTDSIVSYFKFRKKLKLIERSINPNGVMTVFGPCYWKPFANHVMGFANGYFLYEDSPFFEKSKLNRGFSFILKKFLHKFLMKREAKYFWTETQDAKTRLSRLLSIDPSRILVASNTFSSFFGDLDFSANLYSFQKNRVRLLYVSSFYNHKNFNFIPLVYKELTLRNYNCEFFITINESDYNSNNLLKNCEGVINIGPIHPRDCPFYYSQCDIVFVPSLLEIFTAVYPEAMVSRRPIVTSNLDFAVSICGEAALYYDYSSPEDAALRIIDLIENSELRDDLVKKGLNRLSTFDTSNVRFNKILQIIN
jgi:glycosyltransferase involved in cell wall biosynthesis